MKQMMTLIIFVFAFCCSPSMAQPAPSADRITIVVPYPHGASADATMRMIALKVTEQTGRQILIDNRPGGGGLVAAKLVERSAPNGQSLILINPSQIIAGELIPGMPDFAQGFVPLTTLWSFPALLVVPVGSPAKSADDLVKLAKATPKGLTYASIGIGSSGQVQGEMFRQSTRAPLLHIPYQGAAPAVVDLAAGRVDMMFVSYGSVKTFVDAGQLRALAVASTAGRLTALPQVPTLVEAGISGVDLDVWFGLAAPANTPNDIVERVRAMFVKAAKDPEITKKLADQGIEVLTSSPDEFRAAISADVQRLRKVVRPK